jgi:hypothetical protein
MTSKTSSADSEPSLWAGLLFLHGYVADPQFARQLVAEAATAPVTCSREAVPVTHGQAMRSLLDHGRRLSLRLCQGIGGGLVHMQ